MADLPRYENSGVQYADLPRLSTALQQAQIQGYSDLSNQLDKMTSFFNDQAATAAQKAGLKYAIDLPPSKEQLEIAKTTGVMPKVEGAGTIFTEAYNKASASILGNELQVAFQNRLSERLIQIESGGEVDPEKLKKDLRDDIDGTVSVLTALDPETSIKYRASMATLGHTAYASALKVDQKNRELFYSAEQEQGLINIKPVIENVIKAYTAIGMPPDELESVLQNVIQPFTNKSSILLAGGNKYAIEAYKVVSKAKVGAVLEKLSDPTFAPTTGVATQKLLKGDLGELTGIYNSLDRDTKNNIRTEQMKSVSDVKKLNDDIAAETKDQNRVKGNVLTIEFLQPNITPKRRKEIITELVLTDQMNLTTAQELMKPKEAAPNPVLEVSLYEQIKRGSITRLDQLTPYLGKLSRSQYESLARSTVDESYRKSKEALNNEAGLIGITMNPSADKIKKAQDLQTRFEAQLQTQIKDPATGVLRYQTPAEASKAAIESYSTDKIVVDKQAKRTEAERKVDSFFEKTKKSKPNLPLDQIDFSKVQGLSSDEVKLLNKAKKDYQDNL